MFHRYRCPANCAVIVSTNGRPGRAGTESEERRFRPEPVNSGAIRERRLVVRLVQQTAAFGRSATSPQELIRYTEYRRLRKTSRSSGDGFSVRDQCGFGQESRRLPSQVRVRSPHCYGYYALRPKLSRVLLRESLFADEPWRQRFAVQVARVTAHVATLVEQAKEDGELDRATDAQLLSVAFCSFYYLALIAWVQEGIDDPLPLFKQLMTQHLAHLRP